MGGDRRGSERASETRGTGRSLVLRGRMSTEGQVWGEDADFDFAQSEL